MDVWVHPPWCFTDGCLVKELEGHISKILDSLNFHFFKLLPESGLNLSFFLHMPQIPFF